jgi:hypothetical protein
LCRPVGAGEAATSAWDQIARRRIERPGQPPSDRLLDCRLVALRSNVVDKGLPGGDDAGAAVLLTCRGTRLVCEARELLDKGLVADPGSAGGWRPTWSGWSLESGRRSASRRGQSPGNPLPRASRTQERSLDLVAGATRFAEAGAEPPDRPGRCPGERAERRRELDNPPSAVRGLIERHEQLRALEDEDPVRTPRTSTRGHAERHGAPRGQGDRRGQPAQRMAIEHSWGGVE